MEPLHLVGQILQPVPADDRRSPDRCQELADGGRPGIGEQFLGQDEVKAVGDVGVQMGPSFRYHANSDVRDGRRDEVPLAVLVIGNADHDGAVG